MNRSRDRILTTHAGSLPRPTDLLEVMRRQGSGQPIDPAAHAARVRSAVADVVRQQVDVGLDVVDDGEMSKPSFVTYVNDRLGGFEPAPGVAGSPWASSKEAASFPEFYEASLRQAVNVAARSHRLVCTGPISYKGRTQVQADIDNLKSALAGARAEEAFIPAISPTNIEGWQENRYYKTDEEYVFAIAEAMREEYRAIVEAGLLLQIDDPRLITYYILKPELTIKQARAWAEVRVEAL